MILPTGIIILTDIMLFRVEVGGLDHSGGEVVGHVTPERQPENVEG